jgi:hypothetical protein
MKYEREYACLTYKSNSDILHKGCRQIDYYLWCINRYQETEVEYKYFVSNDGRTLFITVPYKSYRIGITNEDLCRFRKNDDMACFIYTCLKKAGFINNINFPDDLLLWMSNYNNYDFLPFRDFADKLINS